MLTSLLLAVFGLKQTASAAKLPPLQPFVELRLVRLYPTEREGGSLGNNLELQYWNRGNGAVALHISHFWANHRVYVYSMNRSEAKLTQTGESLRQHLLTDYGNRDHDMLAVLRPGETTYQRTRLDLGELYKLSPGKYSLVVEYYEQMGDPMRVKSFSLPVTVKAGVNPILMGS